MVHIVVEVYLVERIVSVEEVGHLDCALGEPFYLCSQELFFRLVIMQNLTLEDVEVAFLLESLSFESKLFS